MIYGFTPADITKHEYEASEALYNNRMMNMRRQIWCISKGHVRDLVALPSTTELLKLLRHLLAASVNKFFKEKYMQSIKFSRDMYIYF
jgi:hypothetical protein